MVNLYHKRFLGTKAADDVLPLFSRYKGCAKELTESWSFVEAAKKFVPDVNKRKIIIVGDGHSPRTGAMFAFYTLADVISVDPEFDLDFWGSYKRRQEFLGRPVKRLELHKEYIENIVIDCEEKSCLVIWPHSHANMNNANVKNTNNRIDIALPCCFPIPKNWAEKPHITYTDENILSNKKQLHIWGCLRLK